MRPLQRIGGLELYIVDLVTMPELPIRGWTKKERLYAKALTSAIETRVISEPGKYGIHLEETQDAINWTIHKIIE